MNIDHQHIENQSSIKLFCPYKVSVSRDNVDKKSSITFTTKQCIDITRLRLPGHLLSILFISLFEIISIVVINTKLKVLATMNRTNHTIEKWFVNLRQFLSRVFCSYQQIFRKYYPTIKKPLASPNNYFS